MQRRLHGFRLHRHARGGVPPAPEPRGHRQVHRRLRRGAGPAGAPVLGRAAPDRAAGEGVRRRWRQRHQRREREHHIPMQRDRLRGLRCRTSAAARRGPALHPGGRVHRGPPRAPPGRPVGRGRVHADRAEPEPGHATGHNSGHRTAGDPHWSGEALHAEVPLPAAEHGVADRHGAHEDARGRGVRLLQDLRRGPGHGGRRRRRRPAAPRRGARRQQQPLGAHRRLPPQGGP
mmetsp:Transcript_5195/g.14686  ORF Transcript_5195/g.14686 Transcript_5195/m.14686 type:complete len:232 (+) Transcript_5195:674-1369(+)